MSTITERTERGAAFLDEKHPGWWQRIDLGALDIASRCGCIVGQLAGLTNDRGLAYEWAIKEVGVGYRDEVLMGFEARATRELGAHNEAIDAEYAALTEAWRDLIAGRRAAASVTA